jgi:hypothetical protein
MCGFIDTAAYAISDGMCLFSAGASGARLFEWALAWYFGEINIAQDGALSNGRFTPPHLHRDRGGIFPSRRQFLKNNVFVCSPRTATEPVVHHFRFAFNVALREWIAPTVRFNF